MSKFKQILIGLSIFGLAVINFPTPALANSNSPVEFVVPDTTLVVNGYAAPGALVSIYDGQVLIGSTVAGSDARFSKEFLALDSGLHNIRLEFIDQQGRKSDVISETISLGYQKETTVEYFLPPTFEIVPSSLSVGGLVSFKGSSVPGATIEIFIDGGNTILRPQVDPSGNYTIAFGTDGFFIGSHPASAKASIAGKTSFETLKKSFNVLPSSEDQRTDEDLGLIEPPVILSPSDPTDTDDESIVIRGSAGPNQQIIIYVDGQPVGSTFSNDEGVWYFELKLTAKTQTVTAVACQDTSCSDFSNQVKINFKGEFGRCFGLDFRLQEYRFWGIRSGSGIDLTFSEINGASPFEMIIDWGDGVSERFNHGDNDGFKVHHVFREVGQFNGSVTIEDSDGCQFTRYFSVDVQSATITLIDLWWIVPLILFLMFILLMRFSQHQKHLKSL